MVKLCNSFVLVQKYYDKTNDCRILFVEITQFVAVEDHLSSQGSVDQLPPQTKWSPQTAWQTLVFFLYLNKQTESLKIILIMNLTLYIDILPRKRKGLGNWTSMVSELPIGKFSNQYE